MIPAEAAATGRAVRWILLFCTVFGLATMHTLGHSGVHRHAHGHPPATATATAGSVPMATAAAGPGAVAAEHCPDGRCHDHGGMNGWAVCLAVLGGLAVAVLLAALLLTPRRGLLAWGRDRRAGLRVPRPPPRRWLGLTVASVSVLRI
ncbi:hypothetical protein [Nucisporomicrobium flavum]|uniref:hypothetical protein n=1 Tax=Nucisporomicrobium flavum TaxID=2785915 RepID=UPI0018F46E7C|nr:hypothetical protein [Nucisporomicrobium flavum]